MAINNGFGNQPKSRLKRAIAPYNFVPFPEEVLVRYDTIEELPAHDVINPKLKSGEIHLTITADTPILVAGEPETDGTKCFCRGTDGEYMIPGSTVKGMTRRIMQILGVGLVQPEEDLEDSNPLELKKKRNFSINSNKRFSDGLPERHRKLWKSDKTILDMPHAILGFAGKRESYHSRVSFSDFKVSAGARELPPIRLMLQGPKPSFYAAYTEDGIPYTENFILRGYKQYWLKNPIEQEQIWKNSKVGSEVKFLDKNVVFKGEVRYKNLHTEELGLLLWALRLENGCYHQIGMAKPYGYGRVKLHIDAVAEYDYAELYSWENQSGEIHTSVDVKKTIDNYIRIYQDYLEKALDDPETIYDIFDDFFYMCRKIQHNMSEFRYMSLSEYRSLPREKAMNTVYDYSCEKTRQ